MGNEASPGFLMAVGGVGFAAGLLILLFEPTWVEATGTVTAVMVNTTTGKAASGYRPYVSYRYEVDGVAYSTAPNWCAPPAIHSSPVREDALARAAQIQAGDPVPIRYSSRDPGDSSCLVENRSEWFYLGIGPVLIGGFLLLAGLYEASKARR